MPKIRQPKTSIDNKKVNEFIDGADFIVENSSHNKEQKLNKNAKRDFSAIKVPLNEFEHKAIEFAVNKTGRSKLNFIRYAILKEYDNLKANQ
jgi:hypothetical protein